MRGRARRSRGARARTKRPSHCGPTASPAPLWHHDYLHTLEGPKPGSGNAVVSVAAPPMPSGAGAVGWRGAAAKAVAGSAHGSRSGPLPNDAIGSGCHVPAVVAPFCAPPHDCTAAAGAGLAAQGSSRSAGAARPQPLRPGARRPLFKPLLSPGRGRPGGGLAAAWMPESGSATLAAGGAWGMLAGAGMAAGCVGCGKWGTCDGCTADGSSGGAACGWCDGPARCRCGMCGCPAARGGAGAWACKCGGWRVAATAGWAAGPPHCICRSTPRASCSAPRPLQTCCHCRCRSASAAPPPPGTPATPASSRCCWSERASARLSSSRSLSRS
mmetsp:Transcript_14185/g.45786  ORF Transcript_14185/g.45786 Transcript_14185/m.45786 type:complete len:328 (+) Transcript_14185:138-1121(+)